MIKFAEPKLEREFRQLPEALRLVVRELDELCSENKWPAVTVTCVLRDPDKNAAVGGVERSLHLDGRAVDLRSREYNEKQLGSIDAWLRSRCPRKTYEVITKPHGTGPHIHLGLKRA